MCIMESKIENNDKITNHEYHLQSQPDQCQTKSKIFQITLKTHQIISAFTLANFSCFEILYHLI